MKDAMAGLKGKLRKIERMDGAGDEDTLCGVASMRLTGATESHDCISVCESFRDGQSERFDLAVQRALVHAQLLCRFEAVPAVLPEGRHQAGGCSVL